MISISLIAATAQDRTIGHQGKLPWSLPTDLANFRALTLGHPIIMGRKTFDSIGRPLPGRRNIVVSRATPYMPKGVELTTSVEEAIVKASVGLAEDGEIFIIGGSNIYAAALPYATKIYLTDIMGEYGGDALFPPIIPTEWSITKEGEWLQDTPDQPRFRFLEMVKVIK